MKKFLKSISLVLLLVCMITLTGCGKKAAIDTEDFKSVMEKEGFTIYDSATGGASYGVKKALLASSPELSYQFELYELDDSESAEAMFESQLEMLKSTYETDDYTLKNKSNYSKASIITSDKYIVMYRVDKKCIFAIGLKEDKNDINKIMEKFGY